MTKQTKSEIIADYNKLVRKFNDMRDDRNHHKDESAHFKKLSDEQFDEVRRLQQVVARQAGYIDRFNEENQPPTPMIPDPQYIRSNGPDIYQYTSYPLNRPDSYRP